MPWHDSCKIGFENLEAPTSTLSIINVFLARFPNPLYILQLSCQGICALGKIVALHTKDIGTVPLARG
jgi:hypothetical protein